MMPGRYRNTEHLFSAAIFLVNENKRVQQGRKPDRKRRSRVHLFRQIAIPPDPKVFKRAYTAFMTKRVRKRTDADKKVNYPTKELKPRASRSFFV
jgi:hypothetical protein